MCKERVYSKRWISGEQFQQELAEEDTIAARRRLRKIRQVILPQVIKIKCNYLKSNH